MIDKIRGERNEDSSRPITSRERRFNSCRYKERSLRTSENYSKVTRVAPARIYAPDRPTERVLNKLAMGRHVARPFQRFPLFSRSLNALHTSRGSYLRTFESPRVFDLVSIRGQFPHGSLEWKPIEVRDSRAVSQPSLVESGPGTATRPIARRWKMSGCDPIRCPEDLCVCAATVRGGRNRKRRERERERGTTRSEVYRSAYKFMPVPR